MPISMLFLSGFELYSLWVPLFLDEPREETLATQANIALLPFGVMHTL